MNIKNIRKSSEDTYFGSCSGQPITDDIDGSHKSVASLSGSPLEINGNFYCHNNLLSSLTGGPKMVIGVFNCSRNRLKTLFQSPKAVGACYYANFNQLFSADFLSIVSYDICILESWSWN
jgi:hypothetical protein